jgi:prepilin-type N-terminal cleavage/methylation domain-containing protein
MKRAGFTLLEVAVALAILGIGVVTCLQIFAGSLRLQTRASRDARVVLHARAAMDALIFEPEIKDQTRRLEPTREGFETQIVVRHAGKEEGVEVRDLDFASDMALRYLEVTVWESPNAQPYVLRSLRVAPEDE